MRNTVDYYDGDGIPLPPEPDDDGGDQPWRPRIVTDQDVVIDILPAPSDPYAVAQELLAEMTDDAGHMLLRRWRGEWWEYVSPHWQSVEVEALRGRLYERLSRAAYVGNKGNAPWSPDKTKLDKVIDAMASVALLGRAVDAPTWITSGRSARGVVACRNGLVDVVTQRLTAPTADYFGTTSVPVDYDPHAPEPTGWIEWLHSLWPDSNGDEVRAIQEWFGYVLSGRMDLQKILLLKGPTRCGKGTIARALKGLLGGDANVTSPTLASLATNFGLAPLIGKPLGIIGDARLGSNGHEAIVERLLSISGEDGVTVDRKYLTQWVGTLPTRLMVLSNDLPKLGDASAAVAGRFVVITFTESHLGREDTELGARIEREYPGILKWALDGMARLQRQGRLTEPAGSQEAVQTLYDLVSPIRAFLREVCDTSNPAAIVPFADLFDEYREWCTENNRGPKNTAGFSGDLQSVMPGLKTDHRPKVNGKNGPRHVRGIALSDDWTGRVREYRRPWGKAA